jgi:RNA polymerase sigma factor (sigma-70 family)
MPSTAIPDDPEGFRRLYDAHGPAVYRLLYRLARNAHDAEDLVQDTFATAWRKRRQFRGEGSVEGYLRRIAYRTFLNARHRFARARASVPLEAGEHGGPEPTPAEACERAADRGRLLCEVRRAVDGLPDSWREPFVLFRYEGLTCAEVAHTMGLTSKAVELRLARALHAVSRTLEPLRATYDGATARAGRPPTPGGATA